MICGYVYVRHVLSGSFSWPQFRPRRERRRQMVRVHSGKPSNWSKPGDIKEDMPSEDFLAKEVDPILDKISSHGIDSLTDEERAILDSARKKMR